MLIVFLSFFLLALSRGGTLVANAFVVDVCIEQLGSVAWSVALYELGVVQLHIIDFMAVGTHKVRVGVGVAVEMGVDSINT